MIPKKLQCPFCFKKLTKTVLSVDIKKYFCNCSYFYQLHYHDGAPKAETFYSGKFLVRNYFDSNVGLIAITSSFSIADEHRFKGKIPYLSSDEEVQNFMLLQ